MRRLLLVIVGAGAALGISATLGFGGTAAPLARVVDRTFVCSAPYGDVEIVASPHGATEVAGARFTSSGYGRVTWGPSGDALTDLVAVARPGLRNGRTRFPAAVYASARRCAASRASVPLTGKKLPGPPTALLDEVDCVAARVLVRVRAVLTRTVSWRRLGSSGGAYVGAQGPLAQAELAVRDARTRRPLAFIILSRTGNTKFWVSPDCS
jgi:hypothetical protein